MKRFRLFSWPTVLALTFLLVQGAAQAQDQDRRSAMRKRMTRDDGAPKVGEIAPVFKLESLDGKSGFDLKSARGKRPVVLIFGSYT